MSRKMKGLLVISAAVLLVFGLVAAICLAVESLHRRSACVTVNGVVLTNGEVDQAYDQQKDGVVAYTREQVIDTTVRHMVVRDYGQQLGISVTEQEMDELITHYKQTGYYESAVALYGSEGLRQGLRNHELYERARTAILQDHISLSPVTEEDVQAFLKKNGLEGMTLTDKQREDVVATLGENKRETAYDAFVDKLMAKATIVYE